MVIGSVQANYIEGNEGYQLREGSAHYKALLGAEKDYIDPEENTNKLIRVRPRGPFRASINLKKKRSPQSRAFLSITLFAYLIFIHNNLAESDSVFFHSDGSPEVR